MWVHSLVSADLHFLQLVPSLQTYVVALFNLANILISQIWILIDTYYTCLFLIYKQENA